MENYLLMIIPYAALCCVITAVIPTFLQLAYNKWVSSPPSKERLPPGSMGFPIIGETLHYFKISHSIGIPSYFQRRLKRYGPVFKTSLVGQPVVISLDPELNRFIFQQEGKMFRSWYPETANRIFGKESVTRYSGTVHKFTRSLASKLFGPENLKQTLIREMEVAMKQGFAALAAEPSIDVKDAVADMIFDMIAKKMIGMGPEESRVLRKNFEDFFKGIICFPIYFPGTSFYKCMKGRRNVQRKLSDLLKDRLRTPEKKHGDLLDPLVEELRREKPVIDESFAIDALAALLFASFATMSASLTVGLKLLTDNPEVVKTLKEEHEAILKKRENTNDGFTWEEYKSLTFTTQVMNEISRLSNIAPGIFRKTLMDVQVNGYTIPAGWLVMISPMAAHLNPTLFEDPLKFNPWRWMTQDETKRRMQLKNFMPFGGGIRLCLGADFSKLFISLFLHVLVSNYRFKYSLWSHTSCHTSRPDYSCIAHVLICNSVVWRWNEIKGGEVLRFGEMLIPQGYHIQLVPMT